MCLLRSDLYGGIIAIITDSITSRTSFLSHITSSPYFWVGCGLVLKWKNKKCRGKGDHDLPVSIQPHHGLCPMTASCMHPCGMHERQRRLIRWDWIGTGLMRLMVTRNCTVAPLTLRHNRLGIMPETMIRVDFTSGYVTQTGRVLRMCFPYSPFYAASAVFLSTFISLLLLHSEYIGSTTYPTIVKRSVVLLSSFSDPLSADRWVGYNNINLNLNTWWKPMPWRWYDTMLSQTLTMTSWKTKNHKLKQNKKS